MIASGRLTDEILGLDFDLELTVLLDDVLQGDVDEAVERGDLLRDQAVLLEVGLDHCPCIILGDLLRALRWDCKKLLFLMRSPTHLVRPSSMLLILSVDLLHVLLLSLNVLTHFLILYL